MKQLGLLLIIGFLLPGCASVQLGYTLKPVDMYQARVGSCGDEPTVYALSREMVAEKCDGKLGCTFFAKKHSPAEIYYVQGHNEILQHEMFHCLAGGPLHEGELLVAGRAVAAERNNPFGIGGGF